MRLRKKLEQAGAPEPTLKAIRGSGYQLCISLHIESVPLEVQLTGPTNRIG